uniref:Phosphofurin acidic cluster sorting protein 2 n=1 Tax=Strigamia maritima TaxID=126957 RepID=T1IQR1_STRMM
MADRLNPPLNAGPKPTPVKLYASWEIDRTPPNCIPRVCTLTLTKLVLLKPLGNDLTSLVIAVKVQSSKRILRSNEVIMPGTENILERELALSFSFQYPHFLKREGNKLQILLQRRKRYKNRTMLGFKTLAVGTVGMAEALQKPVDEELELYTDLKEKTSIVAKMTMVSLLSQPVDHDAKQKEGATVIEAGDRVGETYSDEEEDFTSNEEGSDSEPMLEDGRNHRSRGVEINLPAGAAARQRNLKQKFISLLKRFKVTDEDHEIEEIEQKSAHEEMDPQDIEDLFDELEDLSDSGPDMDTVSIMSTPKPSLRPFFPSSRSLIQEGLSVDKVGADRLSDESSKKADSDSHPDQLTDHEQSDPPQIASSPPTIEEKKITSSDKRPKLFTRDKNTTKEKRISLSKGSVERSNSVCHFDSSPRKILLEQLGKVFPTEDSTPDYIIMVNVLEIQGQVIAQRLSEKQHRILTTAANADVRATISFLVSRIQKFCNTNSKAPLPIKVVIIGSDGYVNCVVRTYVEQLSSKPPEWQTYIKFLIIPVGVNNLAKYLGSMDSTYHTMFLESVWRDAIEKPETQKTESQEIVNRISRYINNIASVHQLPIAEAMITYKEKSSDEDSSQIFVPFVSEVRIGASDASAPTSVDFDDISTISFQSSSPPATNQLDKPKEGGSPPSSPSIGIPLQTAHNSQIFLPTSQEPLDLQIDYWTNQSKSDSNKKADSNKNTLKSTFKSLQFMRLPPHGETSGALSMNYISKEKKQKIMRLGKKKEKDKESEPKSTLVEGINRLICLTRSQPLKVNIDGIDWYGVKFFQLSAQWQTHIKHFPVALFVPSESAFLVCNPGEVC